MSKQRPAPRYRIETIDDFAAVPDDRLEECISSFAMVLITQRHTTKAILAIAAGQGIDVPEDAVKFRGFTWIDDGERIVRVHFEEA